MSARVTSTLATAIGSISIILWALLAYLSSHAMGIPPFQLLGLAFTVASITSALVITLMGQWQWKLIAQQPYSVWVLGIMGLFGYHACYFTALKHAPVAEASLLAYLWPLLIVLFSAIADKQLKPQHAAGALLGLIGTYILISGKSGGLSIDQNHWLGYIMALIAALIWSFYSVLNRRYHLAPLSLVFFFCLASAMGGLFINGIYELWIHPTPQQWVFIILLGLGPLGLAFFTWDEGTKHGNLPLLGTLAYLTPLLSTAILVFTGMTAATSAIWLATMLIIGGALVATIPGRKRQ